MLAGASIEKGGEMEEMGPELGNWVTVRRHGKRKSVIEASPELIQSNKYGHLHDIRNISLGVALLK